jgi:hypothetical protein
MRKKVCLFFVFLAFIIVTITGCNSGGGGGGDVTGVKLLTGTKGLTMTFLKTGFQKEVQEGGPFYITLELKNEGYFNIEKGIIVPSIEKDYVEITIWDLKEGFSETGQSQVMFDLEGKSLSNQRGEKGVVSASMKAKEIEESRNKIKSRIIFNACYPYATIFSDTMCVDTDPNNLRVAKKTCTAKDLTSSGQGAPVAITKVEQKIIPAESEQGIRMQFKIYAENKGDGQVINYYNYKEVCTGKSSKSDDYNVVLLNSIRFSDYEFTQGKGTGLECYPNPMREVKGSYFTQCTITAGNAIPKDRLTFETPLVIELAYGYKNIAAEEIEIFNKEPGIQ